ncbi:hypothetical protein EDD16DRAFT_1518685 [Pisolithus croceorrhizus]|nr:hypothetical protein EDD16DRAFT_1518685 [Pisolithus croceorrhizus]
MILEALAQQITTTAFRHAPIFQPRSAGAAWHCSAQLRRRRAMKLRLQTLTTPDKYARECGGTQTRTSTVSSDAQYHPTYHGVVLFKNTFDGRLPAADYPKVNAYDRAIANSSTCFTLVGDPVGLNRVQHYLSGLVAFMIVEMAANWEKLRPVYYRYLNAHGKNTASIVFLFLPFWTAGRNALSFFMLLVVSLGLSVVRETLGRTMIKCQALAAAHFVFGVLYAVGIVELSLESTSALGTMNQLAARKQRYKLKMFQRLYYILLAAVVVIAIFFVVSSYSFSDRLAEGPTYLFSVTLAMSDELAQEDEDAEDYDLEALQSRTAAREDDEITLVNNRREPEPLAENHVVFEIRR